jgi:hypothetical protein
MRPTARFNAFTVDPDHIPSGFAVTASGTIKQCFTETARKPP